jgi:DmsE family decaheme c-type cytochrome
VTAVQTCQACHRQEATKLQKSGHMPLREGKMDCTTCHSPHGSTNVRMLKIGNTLNETCASCHAEKRGPFLHDHAAGRESCASCHDPHGSNNDRMLVAKLPMLCQRCHIGTRHPSTIYDGAQLNNKSNRLIGRGCVNCHAQIHGSNSPAGNAFLR